MSRPRVVVLSHVVPYDGVPHAGGRYLLELCRFVGESAELTLLAANTEINKAALARSGCPPGTVIVGREFAGGVAGRALGFVTVNLDRWWRKRDQGMVYLPYAVGLLTDRRSRQALRDADIVDLQWMDVIRLLPLVRLLNRRARVVGMFHDVQSQSFEREIDGADDPDYWRAQAESMRAREREAVAQLDVVAAFSDKDLALLGRPPHGQVVPPPLAVRSHVRADSAPRSRVLCVSYLARFENDQGLRWLLTQVWPRVRAACPTAQLRVAGAGASPELEHLSTGTEGVDLLGFVDDLEGEYATAAVAAVPVRYGAGLKFKTVEALVRGVPVVTTTVGAEGLADAAASSDQLFVAVTDDAVAFAEALIRCVKEPAAARDKAGQAQALIRQRFGEQAFRTAVSSAYGWSDHAARGPGGRHD